MLTIRKRGKLWHIRGTIRVGQKTLKIGEHSTGLLTERLQKAIASDARSKNSKNCSTVPLLSVVK